MEPLDSFHGIKNHRETLSYQKDGRMQESRGHVHSTPSWGKRSALDDTIKAIVLDIWPVSSRDPRKEN